MTANYDHLLDPPNDDVCEAHGRVLPCRECKRDWMDEYADQQIQDEKEGK